MQVRRVPETVGRQRMWKLESWATGALGACIAQVVIRAVYRMIRKDKAPSAVFDPANSKFSWPDALVWALAGGAGLAIAKMLSNRVAAIGWSLATGTLPPGAEEQAVDR